MLTKEQALLIVQSSIAEAAGKTPEEVVNLPENTGLEAAGVDKDKFSKFVTTIVSNPEAGVRRFEHRIDPNVIAQLALNVSIAYVTDEVRKLAAGKMCSNPATPHPQECCPYPATCPICGAAVR
jgi:hypothetical protein